MISEFIYIGKAKIIIAILALYACTINHNVSKTEIHKKHYQLSDTVNSKKIDSSLIQMKNNLIIAKKCVNELKKEAKK